MVNTSMVGQIVERPQNSVVSYVKGEVMAAYLKTLKLGGQTLYFLVKNQDGRLVEVEGEDCKYVPMRGLNK